MPDPFDRVDLEFQLFDVLGLAEHCARECPEYDRPGILAVLDTAEKLALTHFWPHAAKSDACEPRFRDGRAELIPEIGAALEAYRAAGLLGAGLPAELGGMPMPELLRQAVAFMFSAANIGTAGYCLLTSAAAHLIAEFGTAAQCDRYLRPMIEGRFFGTMCLSEPGAGSSLADITTLATPQRDGSYRISGRKMWISGGDHELSENIVHLVLAKVPGAPAGVRGISLFIVPKRLIDADGSSGHANGVTLLGLNHKMGYRGTTNAALAFGDGAPCVGDRIGQEGAGLLCMFRMMNEARIAVGLGATAIASAGYRHAVAYARERRQGRLPGARDPSTPPVRIIEHADVKRLLLEQKSAIEGALALVLYAAQLVDRIRVCRAETEREDLRRLLELLTPIAKSWPSEFCLDASKHAIQVLGGAGYTRDHPVERLYRDNRLNPIHEGTHGLQGIDLLGRKVLADAGRALVLWQAAIELDIERSRAFAALDEFRSSLQQHVLETLAVTNALRPTLETEPRRGLVHATVYLDMIGHVTIAWMWLRQATATSELQARGSDRASDLTGKLWACRYFFRHKLPVAAVWRRLLMSQDATTLECPEHVL